MVGKRGPPCSKVVGSRGGCWVSPQDKPSKSQRGLQLPSSAASSAIAVPHGRGHLCSRSQTGCWIRGWSPAVISRPVLQAGDGEMQAAPNLALLPACSSNTGSDLRHFPRYLQLSPSPHPAIPLPRGCGGHLPPFCACSGSPSSPPGKQAPFSSRPAVQTPGFARSKWRRFPSQRSTWKVLSHVWVGLGFFSLLSSPSLFFFFSLPFPDMLSVCCWTRC